MDWREETRGEAHARKFKVLPSAGKVHECQQYLGTNNMGITMIDYLQKGPTRYNGRKLRSRVLKQLLHSAIIKKCADCSSFDRVASAGRFI